MSALDEKFQKTKLVSRYIELQTHQLERVPISTYLKSSNISLTFSLLVDTTIYSMYEKSLECLEMTRFGRACDLNDQPGKCEGSALVVREKVQWQRAHTGDSSI